MAIGEYSGAPKNYGDLGLGLNALDPSLTPPTERVFVVDVKSEWIEYSVDTASTMYVSEFESSEDFEQKQKASFNATLSYGVFSAKTHMEFESSYTRCEDRYAAVLSLYQQQGNAQLTSAQKIELTDEFAAASAALPAVFDPGPDGNAIEFYTFFDRFGTHVITTAVVGGKLHYETFVDTTKFQSKSRIKVMVEAEYGGYFSADGSFDESTEAKSFMSNRTASASLEGGTTSLVVGLGFAGENKYAAVVTKWLATIEASPATVDFTPWKVAEFVKDPGPRNALETALPYYLARHVTVRSGWRPASLVVGGAAPEAPAGSSTGPAAIKVRLLDRLSLQGETMEFVPPADGAETAMDSFWAGFMDRLRGAGLANSIVLLATEYWPRDTRFCPIPEIVNFLVDECGAQQLTLDRWTEDSHRVVPCPYAGVAYGLIGNGDSPHGDFSGDIFAIDMGTPGDDLAPLVELSAHLSSDGGTGASLRFNWARNRTKSRRFYRFHNVHWQGWMLSAADSHRATNDTRPLRLRATDTSLVPNDDIWHLQPIERYGSIAYYYINIRTGECMKWDKPNDGVVLRPVEPALDINTWVTKTTDTYRIESVSDPGWRAVIRGDNNSPGSVRVESLNDRLAYDEMQYGVEQLQLVL